MSSWTDAKVKGSNIRIARYLPSSQPKCHPSSWQYGFDSDAPKTEKPLPKGKTTTISLGKPASQGLALETQAQHRAVEFAERGHKLQRLAAKPNELAERSPERCQQTSITSIAHRDLYAGGIEAVLRRSGADGSIAAGNSNNNSPQKEGEGDNNNNNNNSSNNDDVPPLEVLADEGWAKPRIDNEKLRDPYLRREGLHIQDAGVYSHISKRLVSSRSLTKAIVDKSVDFNFKYTKTK